jgi:large subunit ribosomal protein L10
MLRALLCASLCPLLAGFTPATVPSRAVASRAGQLQMASAAVVAKKSAIVEEVKGHMGDSALMFCVRSEGIKVNEMNAMRQKFDDSVTVRCVKNTLVKRAAEDYPQFQGGDSLLEYSNYWFFVPEEAMRSTVEVWGDWIAETNKEEHDILGGMFEGELLDKDGVIAITKLPTKQELMGTTASLLKALPAKLARSLHQAGAERVARVTKQASGQKLVQAVKAMEGKME